MIEKEADLQGNLEIEYKFESLLIEKWFDPCFQASSPRDSPQLEFYHTRRV